MSDMRIVIEAVADEREDVLVLLLAAMAQLRRGKERSGVEENSCLGDYRITLSEVEEPETPYKAGDRVWYTDDSSSVRHIGRVGSGVPARSGTQALVDHSGPRMTGVRFEDGETRVVENDTLSPVVVSVVSAATLEEALTERVLGRAPLRFMVGDRVRLRRRLTAHTSSYREVMYEAGSAGVIQERDEEDAEGEWLVLFGEKGFTKAWAWCASADLDVAGVLSAMPGVPGVSSLGVSENEAEKRYLCPCGDPNCPSGSECFRGSDRP
jgi:hypothetical protein